MWSLIGGRDSGGSTSVTLSTIRQLTVDTTVAGKLNVDMPQGTLNSVLRQAGLK
ncbi:addiction module toxin, HicA family [bacterium]|nr:addiction module toxin, HicA family [bacterium]